MCSIISPPRTGSTYNLPRQTVTTLVTFYPSLLNMEWQLANVPVPSRFVSSVSLSECFLKQTEKEKRKKQFARDKKQKQREAWKAKTNGKDKRKDNSKGKSKETDKRKDRGNTSRDERDYVPDEDGSEDDDNNNDGNKSDDDDDDDEDEDDLDLVDDLDESAEKISTLDEQDPVKKALIDEHAHVTSILGASIKPLRAEASKTKASSLAQPMWCEPWRRSFEFHKDLDLSDTLSRTKSFLLFHTLEWTSVSGNNESRIRREIASAAIHEYCVVRGYRPALLADVDGGAATLRYTLERIVFPCLIDGKGTPAPKGDVCKRLLTWPDAVQYDSLSVANANAGFKLSVELNRAKRRVKIVQQKKAVMNVVRAVRNCELAWSPFTSTLTSTSSSSAPHQKKKKRSKTLRPEIKEAFENLVKVSHSSPHTSLSTTDSDHTHISFSCSTRAPISIAPHPPPPPSCSRKEFLKGSLCLSLSLPRRTRRPRPRKSPPPLSSSRCHRSFLTLRTTTCMPRNEISGKHGGTRI